MTDVPVGIGLDEQFDLRINNTGDVDRDAGAREVEKNVAYLLSRTLHRAEGRVMSAGTLADIEVVVERVLETYGRIDQVVNIETEVADDRAVETVDVTADVRVDGTRLLVTQSGAV